jgi:hypothetical protein
MEQKINKYIAGIDPIEENKSFMDLFLWGESVEYINPDGTIRHISFGSEEYEKLWQEATIVENTSISISDAIERFKDNLTEEEITKLREYGK